MDHGISWGALVGWQDTDINAFITSSYATGNVDGGTTPGRADSTGQLTGIARASTESYGFGMKMRGGDSGFSDGNPKPQVDDGMSGMRDTTVNELTAANAGDSWKSGIDDVWEWDFGSNTQAPALSVDFNGDGTRSVAEFGTQPR